MKKTIITSLAVLLGAAFSSQAQPLPKRIVEAVCDIGNATLQGHGIGLAALSKIPEKIRNMGLKAIKDHKEKVGLDQNTGEALAPDVQKDVREAVCTVGVETLEDNGINLELFQSLPFDVRTQGLEKIKDFLRKNKPAEMGKPAIPKGQGGYPAQMGTQAGYPAEMNVPAAK